MRICFEEDKWLRQALLELGTAAGCHVPLSSLLRAAFLNFRQHYPDILEAARKSATWTPLQRPSCNNEEQLRAFEHELADVLLNGMRHNDAREGVE